MLTCLLVILGGIFTEWSVFQEHFVIAECYISVWEALTQVVIVCANSTRSNAVFHLALSKNKRLSSRYIFFSVLIEDEYSDGMMIKWNDF